MFRHLGLIVCLLACVVTASAQVVIYTGSIRGKVYGEGASQNVAYSALLVYDYESPSTSLIVYGRDAEGQKFQTFFDAGIDGLELFVLAKGESFYEETELPRGRFVETWTLHTGDWNHSLFALLQGLQVAHVDIGFDEPEYFVAPALAGNGGMQRGEAIGSVAMSFRYSASMTRLYNGEDADTFGMYELVVAALQELLDTRYGYPLQD